MSPSVYPQPINACRHHGRGTIKTTDQLRMTAPEEEWERVNGDPFQSSLCALWIVPLSGSRRLASLPFERTFSFSLALAPTHLHYRAGNIHTPLHPEQNRLGSDGSHYLGTCFFKRSRLWWKPERRWWLWLRAVGAARAARIWRKPLAAPCGNHRGSWAIGAAWARIHTPGTGQIWWWTRAHGQICAARLGRTAPLPLERDTGLTITTGTAAAQKTSRTSTKKLMSAARLKAWTTRHLKVGLGISARSCGLKRFSFATGYAINGLNAHSDGAEIANIFFKTRWILKCATPEILFWLTTTLLRCCCCRAVSLHWPRCRLEPRCGKSNQECFCSTWIMSPSHSISAWM